MTTNFSNLNLAVLRSAFNAVVKSTTKAVSKNPKVAAAVATGLVLVSGIGAAMRVSTANSIANKKAQVNNHAELATRVQDINAKLAEANNAKAGSTKQNELKAEAMKLLDELNTFAANINKGEYAIGGQKVSTGGVTGLFGKTTTVFSLVSV